jgi:hypothetical protein
VRHVPRGAADHVKLVHHCGPEALVQLQVALVEARRLKVELGLRTEGQLRHVGRHQSSNAGADGGGAIQRGTHPLNLHLFLLLLLITRLGGGRSTSALGAGRFERRLEDLDVVVDAEARHRLRLLCAVAVVAKGGSATEAAIQHYVALHLQLGLAEGDVAKGALRERHAREQVVVVVARKRLRRQSGVQVHLVEPLGVGDLVVSARRGPGREVDDTGAREGILDLDDGFGAIRHQVRHLAREDAHDTEQQVPRHAERHRAVGVLNVVHRLGDVGRHDLHLGHLLLHVCS